MLQVGLGIIITILVLSVFSMFKAVKNDVQANQWCTDRKLVVVPRYRGTDVCVDPKSRLMYVPVAE
jgi:hypothetical protein